MTIDDFIAMTRRIIAKDGFDGYLPTLILPDRQHIAVLEGVPLDADVEMAAKKWAAGMSEREEDYFLAFKFDGARLKVIARTKGHEEVRVAAAMAG